ncbi:recombinase family protein [Kitasatospora sp. NPDC058048]|uniref:recombinase family protein n=1 Tax=Kitasatospora sp. NPDC058048 TaxID=3346313 RepID=UPI0036DCCF66
MRSAERVGPVNGRPFAGDDLRGLPEHPAARLGPRLGPGDVRQAGQPQQGTDEGVGLLLPERRVALAPPECEPALLTGEWNHGTEPAGPVRLVDLLLRKSQVVRGTATRDILSLRAQEVKGREWARTNRYEVRRIFRENLSAYKEGVKRPDFDSAVHALLEGESDCLWVYDSSRYSRKGADDVLKILDVPDRRLVSDCGVADRGDPRRGRVARAGCRPLVAVAVIDHADGVDGVDGHAGTPAFQQVERGLGTQDDGPALGGDVLLVEPHAQAGERLADHLAGLLVGGRLGEVRRDLRGGGDLGELGHRGGDLVLQTLGDGVDLRDHDLLAERQEIQGEFGVGEVHRGVGVGVELDRQRALVQVLRLNPGGGVVELALGVDRLLSTLQAGGAADVDGLAGRVHELGRGPAVEHARQDHGVLQIGESRLDELVRVLEGVDAVRIERDGAVPREDGRPHGAGRSQVLGDRFKPTASSDVS